jgi:general secretion pathway protein A
MYESFYGMNKRPFALTPDPAFLFLSAKHSLALSMLEYSLTGQAGFTVVTGEIGSGKTTLIREFLKRADRMTNVGLISNTHTAFGDLLQWVLLAFDIRTEAADKPSRYQAFLRYLIEKHRAGKRTVLIVDEAQNLSVDALEELRLLSNVNADKDQLLQMILMGQPELLENLRRPELRQFAQRISVHCHLSPLTYAETRGYILHRLRVAGADPSLFDSHAIFLIYYFAGGIPRLINSICDMALVYGFAEGRRAIDIDMILAVVCDKEKSALLLLPRSMSGTSRESLIAEIERAFGQEDRSAAAGQAELDAAPIEPLQASSGIVT